MVLLTSSYFTNEQHIATFVVRFNIFRLLTALCFIDDWTIGRHCNEKKKKKKRDFFFISINNFIKKWIKFCFKEGVRWATCTAYLQRKQGNLVAQSIMIYLLIKLIKENGFAENYIHHNFGSTFTPCAPPRPQHDDIVTTGTRISASRKHKYILIRLREEKKYVS